MIWPNKKRFAFTIFDDTDRASIANVGAVYSFLKSCGLKTTKSIWTLNGGKPTQLMGDTCENVGYLAWLRQLHNDGFELAFHNASWDTSNRERTIRALDKFKEYFGAYPSTHVNHASCGENVYWGKARVTGIYSHLYSVLTLGKHRKFSGHIKDDALFWGDICRERIKYVRNFVYPEINTLKICPFMPYFDSLRPYVNGWFASSEGGRVADCCRILSERNQDKLEAEGGACILYTHFSYGFQEGDRVNRNFSELITRLSKKDGWFVPVSQLLDYLREQTGAHIITDAERASLERKWLWHKIFKGTS